MSYKSAKGLKGMLILTPNGDPVFRIKANNKDGFEDLDIFNVDLDVEIVDDDAYIYNYRGKRRYINYSKATLGLSDEEEV